MAHWIKTLLVGKPLPSSVQSHQRLGNFSALAIFASDALSSVAYATEEILLVLFVAGADFTHFTIPISLLIVILLLIVTISYRQTIYAYPSGGGAYAVAKENLGTLPGLVAGAALLIDYVLTVAVSVAAGTAAITSALPILHDHQLGLAIAAVLIMTAINLRGVKESGLIFAPPAFAFMFGMLALIVVGFWKYSYGDFVSTNIKELATASSNLQSVTFFLLLRAFASGCTAFTGIEAISNGVKAFRQPEAQNATRVLRWLASILCVLFFGISALSYLYGATPNESETILSQIARSVFGTNVVYYYIQIVTCSILVLAANTSFNAFPGLVSLLAHDRFLPRQLRSLGDRLVYSNGILLLTASACLLLFLFNAKTHALIPLYAVGVFLSFSLSQTGMVIHHLKKKGSNWRSHLSINLLSALATTAVLFAILITKFWHGAWIICIAIPLLVRWFYAVHNHYLWVGKELTFDMMTPPRKLKHTVIIPVASIHRGVLYALEYAKSLSPEIYAVYIAGDEKSTEEFRKQWDRWAPGVGLTILNSPYRSVIQPLTEFIKEVDQRDPEDLVTVVIPSFVPKQWWHNFLHNQTSVLLRIALTGMKNVVITSVNTHLTK